MRQSRTSPRACMTRATRSPAIPATRSPAIPTGWLGLVVCLALGLALFPHDARGSAPPAGPSADRAQAQVSYDLTAIQDRDDAEVLQAAMERAVASALADATSRGSSSAGLRVEMRVEPAKAGFRAVLAASSASGAQREIEIACIPCSEGELVTSIQGRFEGLIVELGGGDEDPSSTSEATSESATGEPNPARGNERRDSAAPSTGRLRPIGLAGVVALGAGVTAMGVGAGLAARPDELVDPTPGVAPELRSTRAPGQALLGAGGAVAVTGAVLLVIDRVRAKRQRATSGGTVGRSSVHRVHAAPWASPSGAGLVMTGRF